QQISGIPGSHINVQIRGRNSIAAGNNPLYIIDGIPISNESLSSNSVAGLIFSTYGTDPLSSIDVSNIESIEILKDADATAIYGSRGANGVILITTKKSNKSKFEVGIQSGLTQVAQKAKL